MAAYLITDNIMAHHEQQPEAITSFEWANAKQFPLISLCWDEGDFLKIMAQKCGHSLMQELNFYQILQSCLAANMSIEAILNDGYSAGKFDTDAQHGNWIDIRPFNGSTYFKASVNGLWSMLVHPKLGPCYTYEIDKSNLIDFIFIYPNYCKSLNPLSKSN